MHVCKKCQTLAPRDAIVCPYDQGTIVAVDSLPAGTLFDGYRIVCLLGVGGMGSVYQAEHLSLERNVALKILLPRFAEDSQVLGRFLAEAKAVNLIRHENIVNIYDFSTAPSGDFYFVMEFLSGENFQSFLEKHAPIKEKELVPIVLQIANALVAVHKKNIVHRDLKPANIVISEETHFVKLLDFGLATLQGEVPSERGTLWGTPHYIAPEYIHGDPPSSLGDQYAFGVILYRALTGKFPFQGSDSREIFRQHLYETPEHPQELNTAFSKDLSALVMRSLEKEPNQRFATMKELASVLRKVEASFVKPIPIRVSEELYAQKHLSRPGNKKTWLYPVSFVLFALAVGIVGAWYFSETTPPKNENIFLQAEEGNTERLLSKANNVLTLSLKSEKRDRLKVVQLIEEVAPANANELLLPFTQDKDINVRKEAILALGRVGRPSSIPVLREQLEKSGPSVSLAIWISLFRLGDLGAREFLQKALSNPTQRINAAIPLAERGSTLAVPILEDALSQKLLSKALAIEAAKALLEHNLGKQILEEYAKEKGQHAARASRLLAQYGDKTYFVYLRDNAKDNLDFAEALARLGDQSALPLILQTLTQEKNREQAVRAAAIYATHAPVPQELRRELVRLLELDKDNLVRISAALSILAIYKRS